MTQTRDFTLGQVLSVTTGCLLCDIGGLYVIVNHLTGDNITTIGLMATAAPCKAAVLEQHPQLRDVDASAVNGENWRAFLDAQVDRFGAVLPIAPMREWTKRSVADDVLDVLRINPNANITVVEP
jgi:hypothetical protein